MDLSQAINQPLAVVLILVVVFGFGMLGIREFFFFMKSVKKDTPIDKLNTTQKDLSHVLENITDAMQNQTTVLQGIAKDIQNHEKLCEMRYEHLLREMK